MYSQDLHESIRTKTTYYSISGGKLATLRARHVHTSISVIVPPVGIFIGILAIPVAPQDPILSFASGDALVQTPPIVGI
jgi:hypothetical protein